MVSERDRTFVPQIRDRVPHGPPALLVIVAMIGFNQAWNVEEERPVGGAPPPPPPERGGETVTGPRPEEPGTDYPPEQRTNPALIEDDGDEWDGTRPNPAV